MRGTIRGHGRRTVYLIDGQPVSKVQFDRVFPDKPASEALGDGKGLCGWKSIKSDALAVHPVDVAEATESARAKGVPTEFLPDGRPVLSSRSHRKAYMQAYGYFDKRGGYGDAQPGQTRRG